MLQEQSKGNIIYIIQYLQFTVINAYRSEKLCKNSTDLLTVQNGSKLIIRFHSDSSENGKGFIVHILREQCKA